MSVVSSIWFYTAEKDPIQSVWQWGNVPLFSVLAYISAECQSKGMDMFFNVTIQPHGVSLHTSTVTRGKYSTWLQGTSIMQHRFE